MSSMEWLRDFRSVRPVRHTEYPLLTDLKLFLRLFVNSRARRVKEALAFPSLQTGVLSQTGMQV